MLDWDVVAPMIVAIVLFLTIGGVLVLRPIAKQLGNFLEMYQRDRTEGLESEVHRVRDLLESMNARLQLMEERQDFTERLLGEGKAEKKLSELKEKSSGSGETQGRES